MRSVSVPGDRVLLVGALLVLSLAIPSRAVAQTAVIDLVLVDASTDLDIGSIADGDTLDLAALPSRALNVRAETEPSTVGSVVFGLDGDASFQVESTAPYALAGDSGGNYAAWTPSVGTHTLSATPYSASGGGGDAGQARTVDFVVVDGDDDPPPPVEPGPPVVWGTLERFHRVTVDFIGPTVTEASAPNPFTDYRLDVTFMHAGSGDVIVVPGFYAADGGAGDSGATGGAIWRVRFRPERTGTWTFSASFRTGADVAIATSPSAGSPTGFDGQTGQFTVAGSSATGRDFRAHGFLRANGAHHLRFSGSGEWYLKGGADSPENLLGYVDFDGTVDNGGSGNDLIDGLHRYAPHVADWQSGDPTWKDGKGKGLIGALNYLASVGMNSVYFLTMNVAGDGREVFPWTSYAERERFDVSKLAQWEIVFQHMTARGIALHVVTQETENDQLLDGGALGSTRALYYRELVARFGHHPALVWNLGEENTNTPQQRLDFIDWFATNDPYDHPVALHTYPGDKSAVYTPLLGVAGFDMPSLQNGSVSQTHATTLQWRQASRDAGRPWIVCLDEIGPAGTGVVPDAVDSDHDVVRQQGLWGNLMAGGGGVEWYFGYQYDDNDLDCEDWRTRAAMWDQTRVALDFFQHNLPFADMEPRDDLVSSGWCIAGDDVFAVYLPSGGSTSFDFGDDDAEHVVSWFDPRDGGALRTGSVDRVNGPGVVSLGAPPSDPGADWAILVERSGGVPVLLSDFGADADAGRVTLDWALSAHDGVRAFAIRRGSTGTTARIVDQVSADTRRWTDDSVVPGRSYDYVLVAVLDDSATIDLARRHVDVPLLHTLVVDVAPNPFNPRTVVQWRAARGASVAVDVFDARGRHVARLHRGVSDGTEHSVAWDARGLASGTYLLRVDDGARAVTRKLSLVR